MRGPFGDGGQSGPHTPTHVSATQVRREAVTHGFTRATNVHGMLSNGVIDRQFGR